MVKSVSRVVWGFLAAGFFVPCLLQAIFYLKIMPIERIPQWLLFVL